MAPTEVLAIQHYGTMKKLFGRIAAVDQPTVALLTAGATRILYENDVESVMKKNKLQDAVGRGEAAIVIGTHALIQKAVGFKKLGLVIVDEQHRFGIEQRAALQANSKSQIANSSDKQSAIRSLPKMLPHFLSMSATPIPRTLMLTIFGDLEISTITELPSGRKNIITKIVAPENRTKAYGVIRGELKKGRQAFVICPRIDPPQTDSDGPETDKNIREYPRFDPRKSALLWDVKAVKEEYEKLAKQIFPDFKVAMLHGQMKPKEKERIMREFKDKDTNVLVSTSVIEVGVDVPNATIMMIEGADRFGLAQLYQFRGRVGRGAHQSFCLLFTDSSTKTVNERLKAIVEAKNGFELAEIDLKLRGPGEFIGQKQTGLPDIAMRGLQDVELIRTSRAAALSVLETDSTLKKYPALRAKLDEFRKQIHLE